VPSENRAARDRRRRARNLVHAGPPTVAHQPQDSFSVVAGVEPPRERYWIRSGNSSQFWRSSTIEAALKRPKLAPKRDRQLRGQCHAKNHVS
jgi:hypothetical protein